MTESQDESDAQDTTEQDRERVTDSGQSPGSQTPIGSPEPRTPAENAQLALLLEVSGTPKPGNVDRQRDLAGLRFEHFMAGSVGSGRGLRAAESDVPLGRAFRHGVAGMSLQSAGNTQFGCLLLLTPLVRAASSNRLHPQGVTEIVTQTTTEDAVEFYRAFEHVDVAVRDPPAEAAELDARRGAAVEPTVRERQLSLYDIMELSTAQQPPDGNALEWTNGFQRTFDTAAAIQRDEGPVTDRAARAFLQLLSEQPDTLIATDHGLETAREVQRRAKTVGHDLDAAEELAREFAAEGINPGTTADATAAALFVALEHGVNP